MSKLIIPSILPPSLYKGLVVGYEMQETSGSTLVDILSKNNGSIGSGISIGQTGLNGLAHSFNGTINATQVTPYSSDFDLYEKFTAAVWFKTSLSNQTAINLFGKTTLGVGAGNTRYYWLVYLTGGNNSDNLGFFTNVENDGTTFLGSPEANGTYTDNNWHLMVCTFDVKKSGDNRLVYVDGDLKIGDNISNPIIANNRNLTSGAWQGSNNYYNGLIDSKYLWNRALSEIEIKLLYNEGLGRLYEKWR
jgi:hypothetical protein